MKISCIVETRAVVAMKILINPLGCSEKEKEGENRRGSRKGRVSMNEGKESGELLKMKGSKGEKRLERQQRMKSHLGQ